MVRTLAAPREGDLSELVRRTAREDLLTFMGAVVRTKAGRPAIPPPHLRRILSTFQDDSLGHTVIVAPPSSAKTTAAMAAAAWRIGRDPGLHVGYIGGTSPQANQRSVAIRNLIEQSEAYRTIFPEILPDRITGWGEREWFVERDNPGDKDPTLIAQGVNGPLLGARLDFGILDDIADERNMNTADQRQKVTDWLEDTFLARFSATGRIVMIATRWHEQDPVGWAIRQGWHLVHIDALTDADESYWPEEWPTNRMACLNDEHERYGPNRCWQLTDQKTGQLVEGRCWRLTLGARKFAQQYRGVVVSDESSLLKRGYWRRYEALPAWQRGGIFVDTAHTEDKRADYSVILAAVSDGVNVYLVDLWRGQVEFPELKRQIHLMRQRWPKLPVVIEKTPGALPIIQTLRAEIPSVFPWDIAGRSKLNRVQSVVQYPESGNVYLPAGAAWADDFIEECASFPDGAHDDQVDAFTMALLATYQPRVRWGAA